LNTGFNMDFGIDFGRSKMTTLFLLLISLVTLNAGGRSALSVPEPKLLPPQVFDMEPYDDVVELQCEEFGNYLNFSGSQLKPIGKVAVSCYCDTKNNHCPTAVKYQDLWFRKGDPIGLKQYRPLPIPERDRIAILIKPPAKPLTEAQIASCASALVRLSLAFSLNRNLIMTVRVPGQSMDTFIAELRKQNFAPYQEVRQRITVLIALPLESEMGRREPTCFFQADGN
jgi:hypothetical protein